jgi:hypothetical protein
MKDKEVLILLIIGIVVAAASLKIISLVFIWFITGLLIMIAFDNCYEIFYKIKQKIKNKF